MRTNSVIVTAVLLASLLASGVSALNCGVPPNDWTCPNSYCSNNANGCEEFDYVCGASQYECDPINNVQYDDYCAGDTSMYYSCHIFGSCYLYDNDCSTSFGGCSDSGSSNGGGTCSESTGYCSGYGECGSTPGASYDDTCGGTADSPSVTYYYCSGDSCASAVTSQSDGCMDTSTSCSANNWACSGTPGTLANTATSGTDSCPSTCQKTNYACTTQDGSAADRCTATTSYMSAAGKVCSAGAEVTPNSTLKCDQTVDCAQYSCSAATYYRGCAAGSASCSETGRQAGTAWTANATTMSNETAYKVGTSCASVSSYLCSANAGATPTVYLYEPEDDYGVASATSANVTFRCYATDDAALANISLWLTDAQNQNFARNVTASVGGTYNFTSQNRTLPNGTYTWNCRAYDTGGNNAFASANRTVVISSSSTEVIGLVLNSTNTGNHSTNNITAYPQWLLDIPGSDFLTYDWRLSGTSIALINMDFDVNNSAGAGKTKDHSTYGNNGTVFGATWNRTGGWAGSGAYQFTGLTDRINLSADAELDRDTWTAEFAIKLNADASTTMKRVFATPSTFSYDYAVGVNTAFASFNRNATVVCYLTNYALSTPQNSVPKNQWTHIVVRKNAGNSFWVYINGVNQTLTTSAATCAYPAADFGIGNRADGTASINGSMDRFALYDRAFSPEQIVALYNNWTNRIVAQELSVGQTWTACVTPNNGTTEKTRACSNSLVIRSNTAPSMTSLLLSSTSPYNSTNGNLTAYPQGLADDAGGQVGLIYDWRLNGSSIAVLNMNFDVSGSGGTGKTKDYSQRSNNGTISEAAWDATGGKNGTGAYVLDGVNDRIYIASPSFSATSNYTVSAWIKPRSYPDTTYNGIVSWGGRTCSGTDAFVLSIQNNGRPSYASYCNDFIPGTGNAATLNQWNHVAAVLRGNNMTLYMNGGSVTGTLSGGLSPTPTATNFAIGCTDYEGRCFNGTIDDVLIINRSLSNEEVLALYNNRSDLLVSQELAAGNSWSVCATPNDGALDGSTTCSNSVSIAAPTTCEYTGGNWAITCAQACNLTGTTNLGDNNLTLTGPGTVLVTGTISNIANLFIRSSCNVRVMAGGTLG